ncbi:MAG: CYTH domain-containing protein [candidate division Zixibacteria bacterium]|nr:CYTH domain-containing protein [candidate division Zixibacteria bacterium]
MNDTEIEIKLDLVDRGNYLKLLDHFDEGYHPRLQKNHFFDSADRALGQRQLALRVRIEEDRAFLTIKGPASKTADGVTTRPEVETGIAMSFARYYIENGICPKDLPSAFRRLLTGLPDDLHLSVFICFDNQRTSVVYTDSGLTLELELDRTEFADGTEDYELEVELSQRDMAFRALPVIHRLMNMLEIPIIPQMEGKFSRALKRKPSA